MIIAKPKPSAPGEEGLIARLECRVSRWFGAKVLTSIPIAILWLGLATLLDYWLETGMGLSARSIWFYLGLFILTLVIWRLYNMVWLRTVAVYDRGDRVDIQVNDRLYSYPWAALRKIRTYRTRSRSGSTFSFNLVLSFKGRTFRLSADDDQVGRLEYLSQVLRQRQDRHSAS